jgi:5-methyltetrahydrofolate--homocysteine methyltransferase
VHDIGKNIVTVVLQCNNFDVVNMGVMVPCHEILAKAREENADIIGLSGLITPSLEEMQYVAAEMEKDPYFRERQTPLLIGGATCSRVHTAVKIAPNYSGPVVYVPDASRSVGVAQGLLGDGRDAYVAELDADYDKVRQLHAGKKQTPLWPLAKARANRWWPTPVRPEPTAVRPQSTAVRPEPTAVRPEPTAVRPEPVEGRAEASTSSARTGSADQSSSASVSASAWHGYVPKVPKFIGRRVFRNFDLAELAHFIDWGPFFQTWDLAGPYPAILQDEVVGEQARKVFADAQAMLQKIIDGRWLTANAVVGLYPANAQGDDIAFYADASRAQTAMTWRGLRQQTEKHEIDGVMRPSRCLSDFVGPQGVEDYAGMFAVTAGIGADKRAAAFEAAHDDYSAIMLKALADRLAEAFAEYLHQRVRTDLWGYAEGETLSNEDLIAEKYQGIRPAPGYPACPDHSAKRELFKVLQCEEIGMGLTESLAMTPAASVSGFYIAHPQAQYFNVGKIGEDQVQDLAARSGVQVTDLQRLLAPNL